MSTDLQFLVEQIAQDQERLRELVNGEADETVILELRTSPTIAGLVEERLNELETELLPEVTEQADRAEDEADLSQAARIAAEFAQAEAEAARDAAFVNADVYADTAAGLADTTVGDQFQVVDGDEIVRYSHDAGPVATEVARYPSSGQVAILSQLMDANSGTESAHIFADDDDNALAEIRKDGSLMIAGLAGSVQKSVEYAPAGAAGTPTHIFTDSDDLVQLTIEADGGLRDSRIGVLQDAFCGVDLVTGLEHQALGDEATARLYFDKAKWANRQPLRIQKAVFGFADDPDVVGCRFAQPLPLTDTTGLFFFTQKNVNFQWGAENAQRIVVCDYNIDFDESTVTTSAPRVVDQPALWSTGLGYSSEPFAIKLTQGPNPGRILLIFRVNDNATQQLTSPEYNFYTRYSDDDGETWSARQLAFDRGGINRASAGQMLELPSGRLVYPIYQVGPMLHGAIYSDDHGATWAISNLTAISGSNSSEPAIVRLGDGTLYNLVRIDAVGGGLRRAVLTSADDGETWVFVKLDDDEALFGNSNTAMLRPEGMGFPKIFAASTGNPTYYHRTMYRVRISYDEGETFGGEWRPFPEKQLIGYSHLAQIGDDRLILGFETASPTDPINPDGDINARNSVHILICNLSEVFYNVRNS